MDFLVGPTFTIDVASSPPPYDADLPGVATAADRPYGLFSGHSSDSESSIGTPDDSDDDENDVVSSKRNQSDEDEDKEEEEEEEVHSKLKGLASLDSLEDSLPIKLVLQFQPLHFSQFFSLIFTFHFNSLYFSIRQICV